MIRHWKKGLFSIYHRTQIAADRPGLRKLTTASRMADWNTIWKENYLPPETTAVL